MYKRQKLIASACLAIIIAEESDESEDEVSIIRRNKILWIKKWIDRRNINRGSLHLLHQELRVEDLASFKNFIRMDEDCFNLILSKSKHLYSYQDTHMRN